MRKRVTDIMNINQKKVTSPILANLAQLNNWIELPSKKTKSNYDQQDKVGVGIEVWTSKLASGELVNRYRIKIRIGEGIIKTLGWVKGDCIDVLFHPDNLFAFRLCKTTTGRSLGKQPTARCYHLACPWPHENVHIEKMPIKSVDFIIYKDALIFECR